MDENENTQPAEAEEPLTAYQIARARELASIRRDMRLGMGISQAFEIAFQAGYQTALQFMRDAAAKEDAAS